MSKLIDLSHTIGNFTKVFSGDTKPEIKNHTESGWVVSDYHGTLHIGTHIDTPFHACFDDKEIAKYPLENFYGKTTVIYVENHEFITWKTDWDIICSEYEIVFFHTGHSKKWNTEKYFESYPIFDESVAKKLIQFNVRVVGFDTPSPDIEPFAFHKLFLKDNRFMIENLSNLDLLKNAENIETYFFPLKLQTEASPLRVVARI